MQAQIDDTSLVLIKTGLNFWAECTLQEAPSIIEVAVRHLKAKIVKLDNQVATIRTHMKLVLQAMDELSSVAA
jgi:prefoldin subunit 5